MGDISACGISTYKLALFLTKILQQYCGNNFSLVKDIKGLDASLKKQKVAPDETVVSFDVSGLFTSIPVALTFIQEMYKRHKLNRNGKVSEIYLLHTHREGSLSFGTSAQQLSSPLRENSANNSQGTAVGSSVSQVITNVYMEYFEEIASGLQCPIPTP